MPRTPKPATAVPKPAAAASKPAAAASKSAAAASKSAAAVSRSAAGASKTATRYAWSKEDRRASLALRRFFLAAKEADQLTHMKLAQGTGINRSLVSQHLAELAPVGFEAARAYAKFFHVDIGVLHPKYKDLHIVAKPPRGYAPAPTDWRLYQRDSKIVVVHDGREYLVTEI